MVGNGQAQLRLAGRIAVIELARRQRTPRPVQHAPPAPGETRPAPARQGRTPPSRRPETPAPHSILSRHATQMPGAARQAILAAARRQCHGQCRRCRRRRCRAGPARQNLRWPAARRRTAPYCAPAPGPPPARAWRPAACRAPAGRCGSPAQAFMQQALARPAMFAVRVFKSVQQQRVIHAIHLWP
jgi:hypothetical protein